jgi:2-polyprenyl-3-methyl-5-hydroxy-6-metoxy-1,4-benzoquinol methylase
MTDAIDEAKLEAFMGQVVGQMTGAVLCFGMWLGDELGLYRAMSDEGPISADDLAERTGCHPRLIREWLDGQSAGGLVVFDPEADRYALPAEHAMALADENSPVFVARAMNAFGSMYMDIDKIADAFRGDGALSWGDHHPCLFAGTEWFFRTGYRAHLAAEWIPALDGVADKLDSGARVADVGCGHGAPAIALAEAYQSSTFRGFDFHQPSISTATERSREAGVADRVTFDVATATSYDGEYDLICFFDCLHDMGDPVSAATHAREHLSPGGTVLLVEPFAIDGRAENLTGNPMAAMLYTASSTVCVPNSLSQDVALGLGAQAGEGRLREVFEEAGFAHFRRATETPQNLIFEARA